MDERPWSEHMSCGGLNITPRIACLLDCVAAEGLPTEKRSSKVSFQEKKALLRHMYADVSQNPKYRAFSKQGVTSCLTTSTLMYSFQRDGVVLPIELMTIQGHRRDLVFPPSMTASQVKDLAGEGMFLPCLATIVWSLYLVNGLRPD